MASARVLLRVFSSSTIALTANRLPPLALILVGALCGCREAPEASMSASVSSTPSSSGPNSVAGQGGAAGSEPPAALPTAEPVDLSVPVAVTPGRGIYTEATEVLVQHPEASSVRYTLDGGDPRGPAALTAALPLKLRIDPADSGQRYLAPGVILRTTVGGTTGPAAAVFTHTYLFPGRVAELSPDQTSPGGPWPGHGTTPGTLEGRSQAIDYGMDPDITQDPEYGPALLGALAALPSLSLVTDLTHLFDADSGIYVNARGRGRAWERFGSMEILSSENPGEQVQANLGLRIRGGSSRSGSNPKHSFRLFFRGVYGPKKLNYPLFGEEGVSSFDKLDLRTTQNYSWNRDSGKAGAECTMNRDVFSRDLQARLGRPYTRSRYYHLYLNGVYWGIYQSEERPDADFAASYFGGQSTDYDVIKVAADADLSVEATDGNLEGWQALWQACQVGFADNANYYRIEGKDASGQRAPALPVLLDVDNLIDYMMVIFYTANFDAPVSKWFKNQLPNNFYAIANHTVAGQGFVFISHDNEHSLFASPVKLTSGLSEDRVNIGALGGAKDGDGESDPELQMSVTEFEHFHPQWLHERLSDSELYRARFATRAHELLDGNGLLTATQTQPLFLTRTLELEQAIIAESARWGDVMEDTVRTKRDDWAPAIARVRDEFLAGRTAIVIAQLTQAGLY